MQMAADAATRPRGTVALLYVGRLAYDKFVDSLLRAFDLALDALNGTAVPRPTLYLAGAGELEGMARALAARHNGAVQLLGTVAPAHVPCVLKQAGAYVSAAANETYGRAQVEALRCGVPIVVMAPTHNNMWVRHGTNGLLAPDVDALAADIVRVASEPATLAELRAGAASAAGAASTGSVAAADALHDPNVAMVEAITAAHAASVGEAGRPTKEHYHLFWTQLYRIGLLNDYLLALADKPLAPQQRLQRLMAMPAGFWGPVDALHTFCEAPYERTTMVCEAWNSLSSILFCLVGWANLARLRRIGLPLRWQATAGWWCVVIVGFGSAAFHTTMRFDAELGDELPMLATVACAWIIMIGAHPWMTSWRGVAGALLVGIGGTGAIVIKYLTTRRYAIFVGGFTLGCVFLVFALASGQVRSTGVKKLGVRASLVTILARLFWETENHLCFLWPWMWVLHSVWHILMCFAANDLFAALYLYRIEKLGANGVVHLPRGETNESVHGRLVPLLLCPAIPSPPATPSKRAGRAPSPDKGWPRTRSRWLLAHLEFLAVLLVVVGLFVMFNVPTYAIVMAVVVGVVSLAFVDPM